MVRFLLISFHNHDKRTYSHYVRTAPSFVEVQKEVADLIKDRILVGHALTNDTQVGVLSLLCLVLCSRFHHLLLVTGPSSLSSSINDA